MIFRHFRSLLKLQSPSNCLRNPLLASLISSNSSQILSHYSISLRTFSISALFLKNADEKIEKFTEPFFKKSVVAPGKSDNCDIQTKNNSENARLKEKLRNLKEEARSLKEELQSLEEEIRNLNKKGPEKGKKLKLSSEKGSSKVSKEAKGNLWKLFADKKITKEVKLIERTDFGLENPMVHKELSSDLQIFAHHLYDQGYFNNANFMPKNKFDAIYFEVSYVREYLKFAAKNFGEDHQEISNWLSAKDLKKVSLFGCPSLGCRSVYAAKHMRRFFEIDEQQVCQKCTLKESCKHENKSSKEASTKKLDFASVTRVLTVYAMESVPQKLVVPQEINDAVSRLLREIVSLTQNTSSAVGSSKVGS